MTIPPSPPAPGSKIKLSGDARLLPLAIVVAFALVSYALVGVHVIQNHGLDAYIYTSLIADYRGVVERYGAVYYATRIAHILPARIIYSVLGSDVGYFFHKSLMLSASVIAIFYISRRFTTLACSYVIAFWAAFNPEIIRPFLWDHYEGSGVAYVLISMALLFNTTVVGPKASRLMTFLSGVFLGLAVNVNPVILFAAGGYLPAWWLIRGIAIKKKIVNMIIFCAGTLTIYSIMSAYMYLRYPMFRPFFESATWAMIIWSVKGGAQNWFVPFSEYMKQGSFFIFSTPAVGLLIFVSIFIPKFQSSRNLLMAALLSICTCDALFIYSYVKVHSGMITLFYYNVYSIPAEVLGLVALGSLLPNDKWKNTRVLAFAGVLGLGLVSLRLMHLPVGNSIAIWTWSAPLVVTFALGAMALLAFSSSVAVVGFCAVAGALALAPYLDATYRQANVVNTAEVESDVYRGALTLIGVVKNDDPSPSIPIGFWYSNRSDAGPGSLDSVQSTHLWGYSRVQPPGSTPGMPVLDDTTKVNIAKRKFLVLLGTGDQVKAGLDSLHNASIGFDQVDRGRFQGKVWGFDYAVLKLAPS